MQEKLRAIRGATTLDQDTPDQVRARTKALVLALLERNDLTSEDCVSAIFTVTPDIAFLFPATVAREAGLDDVALLGAVEADISSALPLCIRVLIHCYSARRKDELQHVFLENAVGLRPDLATS